MVACATFMPEFLTLSFLTAAVVALVAGTVRGFAGFGAAMLMTPVFSALYGPAVGISLCMLLEIVVALPLLPRAIQYVDWRRIGLLMVAAVVGPPIAFYYLAGNETVTRARANLTTYFVFVDLAALAVFLARGLVHWDTGVLALWLAPAVVAGGLLGEKLFPLASEAFYRRLALCLLVGVAIGSLIL